MNGSQACELVTKEGSLSHHLWGIRHSFFSSTSSLVASVSSYKFFPSTLLGNISLLCDADMGVKELLVRIYLQTLG